MSSSYSIAFWLSLCTVYFFYVFLSTLNILKVISLLTLDLIKSRSVWTTWFKLNHFLISWPLTMAHKRTRIYPAVRGSTTTCSSLNLRPNSKKYGSNMVGSAGNLNKCFKIWAGAQLEPVIGGSPTRFKFFKFGLLRSLENLLLFIQVFDILFIQVFDTLFIQVFDILFIQVFSGFSTLDFCSVASLISHVVELQSKFSKTSF